MEPTPNRRTRGALRRELKARRTRLSVNERRRQAEEAARRFSQTRTFRRARRIAVYWPVGAELSTFALIRVARQRGKTVLLPVLGPAPAERLHFVPLDGSGLRRNRFGIPEPLSRPNRLVNARFLDLVVAPLVGFDSHCQRLGMGAGFYDRTFAFLRQRRHWQTPRFVGFAYSCQQVDRLPVAPWDVPLDAVVTEAATWQRESRLI